MPITLIKSTQPDTTNRALTFGNSSGSVVLFGSWIESGPTTGYSPNTNESGAGIEDYLVSTDGGVTYSAVSGFLGGSTLSVSPTAVEVFEISGTETWIAGFYNKKDVYYSTDQGSTWNAATVGGSSLHWHSTFFQNPASGSIISSQRGTSPNVVANRSTDGGATWGTVPGWTLTGRLRFAGGSVGGVDKFLAIKDYQGSGSDVTLYDATDEASAEVSLHTFTNGVDYQLDANARNVHAIGNGIVVVVLGEAFGGVIPSWVSTDLSSFTRYNIAQSGDVASEYVRDIAYDAGTEKFYLATSHRILSSPDGQTWIEETDHNTEFGEDGTAGEGFRALNVVTTEDTSSFLSVVSQNTEGGTSADKVYYAVLYEYVEPEPEPEPLPPLPEDPDSGNDDIPAPDLVDPRGIASRLRAEDYTAVVNGLIDQINLVFPILLDKDESTELEGPLDANRERLTGLVLGTDDTDLINLQQLIESDLGIT